MKKYYWLSIALLATFTLAACSSQAKQEAAESYCNDTQWVLTTSGSLFICTYDDGSVCESEDFRKGSCINIDWDQEIDLNAEEFQIARAAVDTEEKRINACEERSLFFLNINEANFTWENEEESWASFSRYGHVNYVKSSEADGNMWAASDDIFCFIDMVDGSVNVDFSDHKFLGEVEWDDNCYNYTNEWIEYVDFAIALEWEECNNYTFYSPIRNACMGAYVCEWTSEWDAIANMRSGIQDLATEDWMLTCIEAWWEQWAWFNESIAVEYEQGSIPCSELVNKVREYL